MKIDNLIVLVAETEEEAELLAALLNAEPRRGPHFKVSKVWRYSLPKPVTRSVQFKEPVRVDMVDTSSKTGGPLQ